MPMISRAEKSPPNRQGLSLVDPLTLMSIKNLELRAKVVVEGFWNGLHRSPFHGFSVEFTEYRQYSPGDDLRYLDWRLYARSDRYYIKKFEDETNLRCAAEVGFVLEFFDIIAVTPGVETPIQIAEIIPRAVLAIFRKLDGKAVERAAVQPVPKTFDHDLGPQLQVFDRHE